MNAFKASKKQMQTNKMNIVLIEPCGLEPTGSNCIEILICYNNANPVAKCEGEAQSIFKLYFFLCSYFMI